VSYIVRNGEVFVTVEPIHLPYDRERSPTGIDFCWTHDKHAAVRFTTRWHAHAVAKALRKKGRPAVVVRVAS